MLRSLFFFSLCSLGWALWAQTSLSPTHLEVAAQRGDGAYSLLDRYGVRTPCNLRYFYRINQLRAKQYLREGQSYYLPILIYTYNGRSIRSTTDRDDFDWALDIQRFNEHLFEIGLKAEDFRNDRQLWVPYSSLHCEDEPLPLERLLADNSGEPNGLLQTAGTAEQVRGSYEIFGSSYAQVPLHSTRLTGKVYYLVSGHGGKDPGAVGRRARHQLCEDEYAYDITLRLAWNLLSHGATVYLITRDENDGIRDEPYLRCDRDETCWGGEPIPARQKERLFQRSDAVNTLYETNRGRGVPYQRLVVIHVDSDSRNERVDMYFYHRIEDEVSQRMAEHLQRTVKAKYDQVRKGRGYTGSVSDRDLHMLRETKPAAVFIELGNIRNPNDQARLVVKRNRQLVADWLFEGLLQDVLR
jgi:N-acetylmuramoyl-L-alanine amidase